MKQLCVIAAALLFSACASDPPRIPPNPLPALTANETLNSGWRVDAGKSSAGRFEPLLLSDAVVVANRSGVVSKVDLTTGKRSWRKDLDITLSTGVGGDAKQVYVSDKDGSIIALDTTTGDELWRSSASTEVLRPPSAGFDTVVVRSADGRVVALEQNNGDERWSVTFTPPPLTINGYSKPLLLDGGVLVGLDDGRLVAMGLSNGRPIWQSVVSVASGRSEVERLVDVDADILVDQEAIYVVNYRGRVARVEPAKGQIVWSTDMSSTAGLAFLDKAIAVVDENDTVHAVEKESGKVLWSQEALKGRRLSGPAAFGGKIAVGDLDGYLHLLDPSSGEFLGRLKVGDGPIRATPVASDSHLLVQNTDGTVRLFNASAL